MSSITQSIVVKAPVEEVFVYWKNFENFPQFMENIESVEVTGPETTHWKAKGPLGISVEWDAETTYIEESKKIAWKSTGGNITNHGAVVFEKIGTDETEVTVGIEFSVAGGVLGEGLAHLFANPEGRLEEDLQRFKQIVEDRRIEYAAGGTSADGVLFGSDHTAGTV